MALVGEVFAHGQFLVEAWRLENDPESAADRARVARESQAENVGAASGWPDKGRKNPEEGGLSAAVRSEQAEDFARVNPEGDLVKRDAISIAMGEPIGGECGHWER